MHTYFCPKCPHCRDTDTAHSARAYMRIKSFIQKRETVTLSELQIYAYGQGVVAERLTLMFHDWADLGYITVDKVLTLGRPRTVLRWIEQ